MKNNVERYIVSGYIFVSNVFSINKGKLLKMLKHNFQKYFVVF